MSPKNINKQLITKILLFFGFVLPIVFYNAVDASESHYEQLINQYNRSEDKAAIKKKIWEKFGHDKTVFILDMSGFTRIAEKKGIVHFLGLIEIMKINSRLVIEKNSGEIVKFVGDNIYAVFDNPSKAIDSAIDIQKYFSGYNKNKNPDSMVRLSIGISSGMILLLGNDMYGDAVNVASKLGEDIAESEQILVNNSIFKKSKIAGIYTGEVISKEISGINLKYRVIDWADKN